jgi:hypothetical protein
MTFSIHFISPEIDIKMNTKKITKRVHSFYILKSSNKCYVYSKCLLELIGLIVGELCAEVYNLAHFGSQFKMTNCS